MQALRGNTHLRALRLYDPYPADFSAAFARHVLLPSVRANTSLRLLDMGNHVEAQETSMRDAEAIVNNRAAAR